MRQISVPDRTRSIPNRHLDLRHKDFTMEALRNFGGVGGLEEQRQCLDQVRAGFLDRRALARDIELRAKGREAIVFSFDDGGQALHSNHDPSPL